MSAGLSLAQAPPFSAPLRFYLTAPLFLAAAGLLAAWPDGGWAWTASRWLPRSVALTHLLALGYLGLVMLGSLTQMLPVVAGAPLPAGPAVSRFSHAGLVPGIPLLVLGMATLADWALLAGLALVSLALAVFAGAAVIALIRARASPTVWAMRLALVCLLLLWPLGGWLAAWLAGQAELTDPAAVTAVHAGLGLLGWVGLLVVGVAYQVVPMLQVTPHYPTGPARRLAWGLLALLLAWALARGLDIPGWSSNPAALGIAALLAGFAALTLSLQHRRRRKTRDATLDYWRLAMLCLILAALAGLARLLLPERVDEAWETVAGLLFLLGFAAGVVNGMLLKIVPFLAWFHLNAQSGTGATGLVSMKDFIADAPARRQYRLHLAALVLLLPSPWLGWLALPGGLLLALSAGYLERLLWGAWRLFRARGGGYEAFKWHR